MIFAPSYVFFLHSQRRYKTRGSVAVLHRASVVCPLLPGRGHQPEVPLGIAVLSQVYQEFSRHLLLSVMHAHFFCPLDGHFSFPQGAEEERKVPDQEAKKCARITGIFSQRWKL